MARADRSHRFWILFMGLVALRAAMVFLLPLDLSPDEAYYWEWSRHLDWGYYSKPPLIAWVIWFFSRIVGDCTGCIRLAAALLASMVTLFTFLLTRRMAGEERAFWAAMMSAAVPASAVLALVITIDAPLMALWACSLYLLWRALNGKSGVWWTALGLAAGLAMLAKQTAAALWPLAFLAMTSVPAHRRWLRTPWPYWAMALSGALLGPTLLWNMDHGWITIHHTSHHFKGIEGEGRFSPASLLEFVGSQAGLISPLIWLAAWWAMVDTARRWRSVGPGERYLLIFCLPPLVGVTCLSLLQRVNANWPAPFYFTAVILAALHGPWKEGVGWRRLLHPAVAAGVGIALTLLLYVAGFVGQRLPVDPACRLRGWKASAQEVARLLDRLNLDETTILAARRRQTASELAFYLPGHPRVYHWPGKSSRIKSQYGLWPPPDLRGSRDMVLVTKDRSSPPGELADYCRAVEGLGRLEIPLGGGRNRSFTLFLCRGLKGWPSPKGDGR